MFKIITDSTVDMPLEFMQEHQLGCMNLSYILDGETYGQGKELDYKEFYNMMRDGKMPTTSQINPAAAKAHFEEALKESNEILHLAFSSGLSGTYGSVRIAAEEVMEEHPECKIIVLDTLSASMGEGLVVYMAIQLRDAGKSMEETAAWIESHLQNFVHVFTVDDLYHLYRGGRVSKTTAFVGTLAGIKPILHVDSEGHLIPINKVRGRKKSLNTLLDYMLEKTKAYEAESDMVFISHGDDLEAAEYLRDLIKERTGREHFMINNIGPTIGAHAGPGTIALFFLGESR